MSQTPAPDPTDDPTARAGVGVRVWGVVLSLFAVGLGVVGLFVVPDNCRVIGYVAAALFIPAGAWMLFLSLRGRKADLKELSAREAADGMTSGAVGEVVSRVVDHLG